MAEPAEEHTLIRRYLLSDLDEEQQERVETRLLLEEDFGRDISVVRNELFDEYVAGTLSESERERFEQRHLATPDGRRNLLFTKALHAYAETSAANGGRVRETSSAWQRFLALIRTQRLSVALPLVALLLLASFYAVWRVRENRRLSGPESAAQARRATLEQALARLNAGEGTPTSGAEQPGAVASATLIRNLVRGEPGRRSVTVGGAMKVVRLHLVVEADRYERYSAVLLNGEDAELAAVSGLPAGVLEGGKVVTLNLPADQLPAGDYQVSLNGISADGRPEPVGLFSFRLLRQ